MTCIINGKSQSQAIKDKIYELLDMGMTDKLKIYSKTVEELQVPRPTVRRMTRSLIQELQRKTSILQGANNE